MKGLTEAPWRPCKGSGGDHCLCGMVWCVPADVPVAVVLSDEDESYNLGAGPKRGSPEYMAVQRLIEAAPSLRDALSRLMLACPCDPDTTHGFHEAWKQAEELLGKLEQE